MIKLNNFNNSVLSDNELVMLQGGKITYKIGDREVTKDEYKDAVAEAGKTTEH